MSKYNMFHLFHKYTKYTSRTLNPKYNSFIVEVGRECSVCGKQEYLLSVECSNDPKWVQVYK
jgi:hypothetical protein